MNHPEKYDYIIAGAGLAGLSLAMHLLNSSLAGKNILIVDKEQKNINDRTWCFWEKTPGLFEDIVYKRWEQLLIYNHQFLKQLQVAPYQYKLIKGIDFYKHCIQSLSQHLNIHFLQATVDEVFSHEETGIIAGGKKYLAQYVFSSLYQKPLLKKNEYWLLQHFKGWFVKTAATVFDPATATLMDFRTGQQNGTTFFYVLPFSGNEALIEYTLFSDKLLPHEAYENALNHYVAKVLGIEEFTVTEKEFGMIPMTNYRFPSHHHHIIPIGTAGGQTKGSSGYTFQSIQKHSAAIVQSLEKNQHPAHANKSSAKFRFYDSVLLNILHHKTLPGDKIFTQLFKKNKASAVFSFLDNESKLGTDLSIISTLPTLPFIRAAMQQIF